jgi:hypothetical protein
MVGFTFGVFKVKDFLDANDRFGSFGSGLLAAIWPFGWIVYLGVKVSESVVERAELRQQAKEEARKEEARRKKEEDDLLKKEGIEL